MKWVVLVLCISNRIQYNPKNTLRKKALFHACVLGTTGTAVNRHESCMFRVRDGCKSWDILRSSTHNEEWQCLSCRSTNDPTTLDNSVISHQKNRTKIRVLSRRRRDGKWCGGERSLTKPSPFTFKEEIVLFLFTTDVSHRRRIGSIGVEAC